MPLYQVQSKQGKNIKTIEVEGKSVSSVLAFFEDICTMKVTLIREIVYRAPEHTVIPIDDFNYHTIFMTFARNETSNISREFILNNIKKNRDEHEIFAKMKECFEIDGLKIDSIYSYFFKD